ncbi:MAG: chromosomal replication initiator protein DnaA [Phycisphaerae bacterium]|nr:chromosomal replication initiator protein DnaA [Phycisphaerae bacterium]
MGSVEPQLWQGLIQHVVAHGKDVIRPWFSQLEPGGLDHGQLEILAPGPQEQAYCAERASRLFVEAAQAVTGRLVSVRFSLADEPPSSQDGQYRPVSDLSADGGDNPYPTLSSEYTFESFVTGPCNRLATAACVAVADRPGRTYNPLFVHGAAGLGKTHLLQATCQSILAGRDARISFLSCETFVNHLIEAIETGRLHEFRYRYRSADLLVIDDVQFLANHDQTQEEFFHTFNTLYQSRKQIILSCDRPPAEIPHLEERLVSRFNWGLVARIDRPGYETRMAILHKKASARNITLPDDVVCFVAGTIDSNIRELEGAITKIDMLAQVLDRPIDLALAEEATGISPGRNGGEVTIEQIITAVTRQYSVRLSDLQSKKRSRSISLPRQICMYLARSLTRHSLEEIGGYFGGRDHSTVLHADRAIKALRQEDVSLRATLERLTQELRNIR